MRKIILPIALLVALAGCANKPVTALVPQPARGSFTAVATLAVGGCEYGTAAEVSAVIVNVRAAARATTAGRMTPADARRAGSLADDAKADFDAACRGRKNLDPDAALLASGRAKAADLKTLVENAR